MITTADIFYGKFMRLPTDFDDECGRILQDALDGFRQECREACDIWTDEDPLGVMPVQVEIYQFFDGSRLVLYDPRQSALFAFAKKP